RAVRRERRPDTRHLRRAAGRGRDGNPQGEDGREEEGVGRRDDRNGAQERGEGARGSQPDVQGTCRHSVRERTRFDCQSGMG
ncbi:hypothetical protein THAOC_28838, partial [Thalassiosira oceanica]